MVNIYVTWPPFTLTFVILYFSFFSCCSHLQWIRKGEITAIYIIIVVPHPLLLIDLKLKGHLHGYKLQQIFSFFMGFHIVPLLKRMVWLKILYIQKSDELLLETVECSHWWKIYFYKKILYKIFSPVWMQ